MFLRVLEAGHLRSGCLRALVRAPIPSRPHHLPRAPPLNPITRGIKAQHMNVWERRDSTHGNPSPKGRTGPVTESALRRRVPRGCPQPTAGPAPPQGSSARGPASGAPWGGGPGVCSDQLPSTWSPGILPGERRGSNSILEILPQTLPLFQVPRDLPVPSTRPQLLRSALTGATVLISSGSAVCAGTQHDPSTDKHSLLGPP